MRRITRFSAARKDIVAYFEQSPDKVFKEKDLSEIFHLNWKSWNLAKGVSSYEFIEDMVNKTRMKEIKLQFPTGRLRRYTYGTVSVYYLALGLKSHSYFSHYTAVTLHQLAKPLSKSIYVTFEQSPKNYTEEEELAQEDIDRAFAKEQRISQNHVDYKGHVLYLLNGKNTGHKGIISIDHPKQGVLEVTNLERTLIDIAVRPAYSGGVKKVMEAYQNAKERVSVEKLNTMLKEMDFTYSYHQVIGFYMERAGYLQSQLDLLKEHGFEYKFYLTYNMREMEFSEAWQLYYPKGF